MTGEADLDDKSLPPNDNQNAEKAVRSERILRWLVVVVFVAGCVYWFTGLNQDPPIPYSSLGQSVLTDPGNVVYHARNSVLFGKADPFSHGKWIVFERSVTSLTAVAWFKLFGVSYAGTNAVGTLLNLTALGLFLLGLCRHHRAWVLLLVTVAWMSNATFLTLGRLGYLENGLLLVTGVSYWVYSWWGDRRIGVILTAVAIAVATVMGKIFGLLLFPALVIALFLRPDKRGWRDALLAIGVYALAVVVLALGLYWGKLGAVFAYTEGQSYGLHGFPPGLKNPVAFIQHLIQYGFRNGLYYITPDLFVYLAGAGIGVVLFAPVLKKRLTRPAAFSLAWIGCVIVGLMPHAYSPLRYALLLFPAVFTGFFALSDQLLKEQAWRVERFGPVRIVAAALLIWYVGYHLTADLFALESFKNLSYLWLTGAGSAVAAVLLTRARPFSAGRRGILIGIALLAVAATYWNGLRVRGTQYRDRTSNIIESSADLQNILGPNAVVSGPYGPVLTLNTHLHAFIHMFGGPRVDSSLIQRTPITHLALDETNYKEALRAYPELAGLTPVTSYWINGWEIKLYRVTGLRHGDSSVVYHESGFERAVDLSAGNDVAGAGLALKDFLQSHPVTKSPGMLMAELLFRQGQVDWALRTITSLADQYRDNFYVQMKCGQMYYLAGLVSHQTRWLAAAEQYFRRGVKVNRFKAAYVDELKRQARRAAGAKS